MGCQPSRPAPSRHFSRPHSLRWSAYLRDAWKYGVIHEDIKGAISETNAGSEIELYYTNKCIAEGDWLVGFELLHPQEREVTLCIGKYQVQPLQLSLHTPVPALFGPIVHFVPKTVRVELSDPEANVRYIMALVSMRARERLVMHSWIAPRLTMDGPMTIAFSRGRFFFAEDMQTHEETIHFIPCLDPVLPLKERMQQHKKRMSLIHIELLEKTWAPERLEWVSDMEVKKRVGQNYRPPRKGDDEKRLLHLPRTCRGK